MSDNIIKNATLLSPQNSEMLARLFSLTERAVAVKDYLGLKDSKIEAGAFYLWFPEYQEFLVVDPTNKSLNYANKDLVVSQENFSIDFGTLIMVSEALEVRVLAAERLKEDTDNRALETLNRAGC